MAFEKGHPYYPRNPNSPGRKGLNDAMSRLTRDREALSDEPSKLSWLTGGGLSEKGKKFQEEIDKSNEEYNSLFATKTVISIPEPDYYQGPELSTRVIKHRFVPNNSGITATGLNMTGTAYVQFGGTRKNGKRKTEDIYAYYNMPPSVYLDFCQTDSKGQTIDAWTTNYPDYRKLNDPSVFSL
jgi:hypothetical protein